MGAVKWLSPALGEAYDNLFRDTDKNDLTGAEGKTLRARVGQILQSRKVSKSGETAEVLASLYEAGHKAAVPSNTPGSVTVKGEKHTLNEYQKQTYETVWNSIVGDALDDIVESSRFRNADEKKKTQIISKLYDYAAESAKSELFDDYEVESATGKIMQINKSGLDLAECIAWSVESSGMKQAEKFQLLRNWTMSENAKKTIVGTLVGTEMKTETGKDSKYAKMLEALKSGVTIDEYLDMCLDGTEIEDYLELIEEGMDSGTAYELLDYVSDLELKKEDLNKIQTVEKPSCGSSRSWVFNQYGGKT